MSFNKFKKISISFFLIIFLFSIFYFLFSDIVFAETSNIACDNDYPWCKKEVSGLGGSTGLINTIYNYSLALVGVAALGVIIYGGILWIVSAGNPSKISEAKEWITGAIYGLILLISAALLFNTINPQITKLKFKDIEPVTVTSTLSTALKNNKIISDATNECISLKDNKEACKALNSQCKWINNSCLLNSNYQPPKN